ncbi:MAG TPA: hypothetical protein VIG90_13025 [Pedomonas sp.]|uniref:hypothetical protein n=1 Tax=Pedomonas sp. TaxID=2976421 RepID=UPI002F426B1A
MFSKFLRTSIATLAVAFSPVAAEAALYEAIWQVQLTKLPGNDPGVDIIRPASFEYKVRFSNDVWYIDDEFELDTMTFFDRAPIIHTRPAMDYLPTRPEGGTRLAYNNVFAYVADDAWAFSETVNATQHEFIDTGDLYWQHSTYLQNSRTGESRGGTGEHDYSMSGDAMIAYLEEVMANPDAFSVSYSEQVTIRAGKSGDILYSIWWFGDMQLTSLRELEATDVSEPPLLALLGTGLAGIALFGRRKRHLQKEAC